MDKNYLKGIGVISLAYPIKGSSGNVQVDLMMQDDIDFAKWIFHSPDFTKNESKWKGRYRTALLMSISNSIRKMSLKANIKEKLRNLVELFLKWVKGSRNK